MASERIGDVLTQDQLSRYFERLRIPREKQHNDAAKLSDAVALEYLTLLKKHHLAEIPFENLTLHYSPHRQVSVHPQQLFQKIIGDENCRGGYCMENNRLFYMLLRALGFNVYSGGARVFTPASWTGWSHMVNLVTIGSTKYHVDVAFGADGPIVPMPLNREGSIQPHIRPSSARLQWRNIQGNSDPNQRLWVYEGRRDDDAEWDIKYCFTELEFMPADFKVMNYHTSTSHQAPFARWIIADKKIMDEQGELVGSVILNGNVIKWRIHGAKEKELVFETESQRLDALEKHFGIKFGEAEREGISGLATQLK